MIGGRKSLSYNEWRAKEDARIARMSLSELNDYKLFEADFVFSVVFDHVAEEGLCLKLFAIECSFKQGVCLVDERDFYIAAWGKYPDYIYKGGFEWH